MSLRSRVARWLSPAPAWASFSKLMQVNGPLLLKEAIRDTAVRRLNADERAAIKRIESLRSALDCCDAQITFLDFGAGSPQDSRSETEMTHGVTTTRTVGTISRSASSTPEWGMFMYQLVRKYRPRSCVEMGTCLGIASSYIATALKFNGSGRLVTLEGAEPLARLATKNLSSLDLCNVDVRQGRFADTLEPVLQEMAPVDFIFIDGHHDELAAMRYFEVVRQRVAENCLVIFDDIAWSEGMKRAWRKIQAETGGYDLGRWGICAMRKI